MHKHIQDLDSDRLEISTELWPLIVFTQYFHIKWMIFDKTIYALIHTRSYYNNFN